MTNLAVREPEVSTSSTRTTTTRSRPWLPFAAFVGVALVLWLVVWLSATHLSREPLYSPAPAHFVGGSFFEGWVRWDAPWYRSIARDGYVYYPNVQSSVAFFPAYPLTVRLLSGLFPSIYLAAIALTVASGVTAAVSFYRWCSDRLSPRAAVYALLALLLYPYSWYLFGAVYADAFFLAAIIGAFVLLEKDKIWLAGLVGALATAARPTGIALAVALVLRLLEKRNDARRAATAQVELGVSVDELVLIGGGAAAWPDHDERRPEVEGHDVSLDASPQIGRIVPHLVRGLTAVRRFVIGCRDRFDPRSLRRSDAPVLLAFAGLAGYALFLWVRFGHPFLFAEVEGVKGWDQPAGPHTWLKVSWFETQLNAHNSTFARGVAFQAVLGIGFLLAVPRVARRFGWAYAAFVLIVVGIPVLGSKDFQGVGRYLLAAFPVFALAGEALAGSRRLRRIVLPASALLLVFFASLFARGYYLA